MANSDNRYEMLRDRELSKLSWVVKAPSAHTPGAPSRTVLST